MLLIVSFLLRGFVVPFSHYKGKTLFLLHQIFG
nr:MAG TPA: hypothetical protein [Caudoviricetes sp.]